MPQKEEGKRMLPPISVPKPRGEPPDPMRAPSPPEEPPGLLEDFHGFRVWPKSGLLQSKLEEAEKSSVDNRPPPAPAPPSSSGPTLTWTGGRWCARRAQRPAASAPAPPRCHTPMAPPHSNSSPAWSLGPSGRDGYKEDTMVETGSFSSSGTLPPSAHWPAQDSEVSGPEASFKPPERDTEQRKYGRLTPGRAYLVAEAFLEAHRDAIEQALSWGLG